MPDEELDVDREVAFELEAAEELAAQKAQPAAAEEMDLVDWRKYGTPAWDATKFTAQHLKSFLAALPQARVELIPDDNEEGVASWEAAEQKVGPREKMQGPHAEPAEGESDGPPEAPGAVNNAWVCTLSCPTEEAAREKKLKKPGEFTRCEILKALLAAVAKTNGVKPGVSASQGRKDPLLLKYVVVFQERHASGEIHYHVALRSDDVPTKRPFRFKPIKDALRESVGLESHWSAHGG